MGEEATTSSPIRSGNRSAIVATSSPRAFAYGRGPLQPRHRRRSAPRRRRSGERRLLRARSASTPSLGRTHHPRRRCSRLPGHRRPELRLLADGVRRRRRTRSGETLIVEGSSVHDRRRGRSCRSSASTSAARRSSILPLCSVAGRSTARQNALDESQQLVADRRRATRRRRDRRADRAHGSPQLARRRLSGDHCRRTGQPRARRTISRARSTSAPAANGFSELRLQYTGALRVLMVVVALVLLIACANVANLLLPAPRCASTKPRSVSPSAPDAGG